MPCPSKWVVVQTSNEDLVVAIQSGAVELIPTLWRQVERFVRVRSNRVMTVIENRADLDTDDLYQCGFFAMLKAVDGFDSERGSFIALLALCLKTEFSEATGLRGRKEPCVHAVSLSQPIGEDEDGELGDRTEDPTGRAALAAVDRKVWREQLHAALEAVLSELPDYQADLLRRRFYDGATLEAIAGETGKPLQTISAQIIRALRSIRRSEHGRALVEFLEGGRPPRWRSRNYQ